MSDAENRAEWELWGDMVVGKVELWTAIALSMDIEPRSLLGNGFDWRDETRWRYCSGEYHRRLMIAVNQLSAIDVTAQPYWGTPERTPIPLPNLCAWAAALSNPWDFPDKFPKPSPPETQVDATPNASPEATPRPEQPVPRVPGRHQKGTQWSEDEKKELYRELKKNGPVETARIYGVTRARIAIVLGLHPKIKKQTWPPGLVIKGKSQSGSD